MKTIYSIIKGTVHVDDEIEMITVCGSIVSKEPSWEQFNRPYKISEVEWIIDFLIKIIIRMPNKILARISHKISYIIFYSFPLFFEIGVNCII